MNIQIFSPILLSATLSALFHSAHADVVTAKQADAFVDSTGIATHWSYNNVYRSRYRELRDKLLDSGIRFCRDGGTSGDFLHKMRELARLGVKHSVIIDPPTGTKPNAGYWAAAPNYLINDYLKLAGPVCIKFVELNNELDLFWPGDYWADTSQPLSNDPASAYYWAKYLKRTVPDTWNQIRGDAATAALPIVGPSLTTEQAYTAVGDLTPSIDYSCVHHYMAGRHPETNGWGNNGYGSIDWTINYLVRKQSPTKGYAATEGGNATASQGGLNQWPLPAHGRYIPRFYLAHFVKGYAFTTIYELVDEGTDPADSEKNYGLLKNDLAEKPGYRAIKNLLSLLKDPGPLFSPGTLEYTLTGATGNVWSTLLQKRNGDFYLCLWVAKPCYDPITGNTLTVAPQTVTLTVPASIAAAKQFALDDAGDMAASALTIGNRTIGLNISDRVTTIRLSTKMDGGIPSIPTALRAEPGDGQVLLKWAPSVEATAYNLKRSKSPGGPYKTIATVSGTNFNDTTACNGMTYYYCVSAVHSGGESSLSAEIDATPSSWAYQDIGSVAAVGYTEDTSSGHAFLIEGAGADIWNTADGFRYLYKPIAGDCDIAARVSSLQNTDAWAKAGVMIRESLGAGSRHASLFITPANGVSFQRRTSTGGSSAANTITGVAAPRWVRIARSGNLFTGYQSADGVNWTTIGSVTISMSSNAFVGLAVTSHKSGTLCEAAFDQVRLTDTLQNSWTTQDVGSVGAAGRTDDISTGSSFSLDGAGSDIWNAADEFHYAYRPAGETTEIRARVENQENTSGWAKAGVMMRDNLAADAMEVSVLVTPSHGIAFQRRTAAGGSTSSTSLAGITAPVWVRLNRSNTQSAAYYSLDGTNWTSLGSASVSMASSAFAGLCVSSQNDGVLCSTAFSGVALSTP